MRLRGHVLTRVIKDPSPSEDCHYSCDSGRKFEDRSNYRRCDSLIITVASPSILKQLEVRSGPSDSWRVPCAAKESVEFEVCFGPRA